MKLITQGYGHSRDYGYFAIEANDDESSQLELIGKLFTTNKYIDGLGGDNSYVDFVYNKTAYDMTDIRKMWKSIKSELKEG